VDDVPYILKEVHWKTIWSRAPCLFPYKKNYKLKSVHHDRFHHHVVVFLRDRFGDDREAQFFYFGKFDPWLDKRGLKKLVAYEFIDAWSSTMEPLDFLKLEGLRDDVHPPAKWLQVLYTSSCMECRFVVWSNVFFVYLLIVLMMVNLGLKTSKEIWAQNQAPTLLQKFCFEWNFYIRTWEVL